MKYTIGLPNIVLIACQVLMCLEIRLSLGLKCLSCRSAEMKTCFKTTTTCRNNEKCYLEKVVDSHYNTTFNAGCKRTDACPRGPSLLNLIGRRGLPVSDLKRNLWNWTVCSECCNTQNRSLPCNSNLCNQGCLSVKSDIVFLLDSSSSIGNSLFEHTLKTFAVDFISNPMMLLGPEYNQVGLMSFTGHTQKITSLNRYHDKASMAHAVMNNFHFETGSTETHEALNLVKNLMFTPLFGDRPDAENVLVIITDGGSHFPPETLKQAEKLKKAGVRIYVIGVGDYNTLNHLAEIHGVSSGIFATYGLYPYNPKAIQELLWKSICQHSTTRLGDNPWLHHTTKGVTSKQSSTVATVKITVPTAKTTVPTAKITVPTAKITVPPAKITVPTVQTRTSIHKSPTGISVPTAAIKASVQTSRISVPTTRTRISVPTLKPLTTTNTPAVSVVQTTPAWVSLQTNKSTTRAPCVDNPLCIASGVGICSGGYAHWARGSCPRLCGYCNATSTTTLSGIPTTSKPSKFITIPSGQTTRISIATRKQTKLKMAPPTMSTGKTTRSTRGTTNTPNTTNLLPASKSACKDQTNCSALGPTVCGMFASFAKTYCTAYCGFCTPPITTALTSSKKPTTTTPKPTSTTPKPTTPIPKPTTTTPKPTTTTPKPTTPTPKPTTTTPKPTTTTPKPTTSTPKPTTPTPKLTTTTPKPTTTTQKPTTTTPKPTKTTPKPTTTTPKPTTSTPKPTTPTPKLTTTTPKPTTTTQKPTTTTQKPTTTTQKPTTTTLKSSTTINPTFTTSKATTKTTTSKSKVPLKPTKSSPMTSSNPSTYPVTTTKAPIFFFNWKTIHIPG